MERLKAFFNFANELINRFGNFCADLIESLQEWFTMQSLLNKLIMVNIVTAFLAVVLPLVKYWMWESWVMVNNPIGVYLIFISAIMFFTIIKKGRYVLALRIFVNAWYLLAFLVKWWNQSFCKTSYHLTYGFIFNILAPVIFIALSLMVSADEQ